MTSLTFEKRIPALNVKPAFDYRADIDGLRALAVLSIVIFHAFPRLIPGGLLGVDIFFVISGFLITSIIAHELQEKSFTTLSFYTRRVIRLLPALLIVLTSCLVVGWMGMLGDELESLAKHVLSGIWFSSNLLLWHETSYFDTAADTKPLLHLWSLGVEEQFYLIFPLILAALWGSQKRVMAGLCALFLASFIANLFASQHNPVADFFSPATRGWELLAGSLIGISYQRLRPAQHYANVISAAGMALIGVGLVTIKNAEGYPGLYALLPVIGTSLLIIAGPSGVANRLLLSSRPMVLLGLISYPLYLWHWPLLVFPRIFESATASVAYRLGAVALAVLLAWLTYQYVERPIRTSGRQRSRAALALCCAAIALSGCALLIMLCQGFPNRVGAKPVAYFSEDLGRDPYVTYMSKNFYRCSDTTLLNMSFFDNKYGFRCFQSKPDAPVDILLLGDSHAEHLLPGLAEQFNQLNVASFIQNDLPIINGKKFEGVFQYVARSSEIKAVIVSALWGAKVTASMSGVSDRLAETFFEFKDSGKKLFVFEDVPSFTFDPEKCKYGRRFSSAGALCTETLKSGPDSDQFYLQPMGAAVKAASGVANFIPIRKYFCEGDRCRMTAGSSLLFRDSNHLTISGSRYLARRLMQANALSPLVNQR